MTQDTGSLDTEDLEKTEEHSTDDLFRKQQEQTEEVTEDIDTTPVRSRFDSSHWIKGW